MLCPPANCRFVPARDSCTAAISIIARATLDVLHEFFQRARSFQARLVKTDKIAQDRQRHAPVGRRDVSNYFSAELARCAAAVSNFPAARLRGRLSGSNARRVRGSALPGNREGAPLPVTNGLYGVYRLDSVVAVSYGLHLTVIAA